MRKILLGALSALALMFGVGQPQPTAQAAPAGAPATAPVVSQEVAFTAPAAPAPVTVTTPRKQAAPLAACGVPYRSHIERRRVRYGRSRWIVLG